MDAKTEKSVDITPGDDRFQKVMAELEKTRGEVVSTKQWFERHSTGPRILFRVVGAATILLSVLVPFLATLDGVWKVFVLPAVAVAIAGLTSFNAFFQWQGQWQGNRQTQYALEHILSKWEVEIIKARFHRDREKAVEIAIEATSQLLDQAREITNSTTGDFFKKIQLPTTR